MGYAKGIVIGLLVLLAVLAFVGALYFALGYVLLYGLELAGVVEGFTMAQAWGAALIVAVLSIVFNGGGE